MKLLLSCLIHFQLKADSLTGMAGSAKSCWPEEEAKAVHGGKKERKEGWKKKRKLNFSFFYRSLFCFAVTPQYSTEQFTTSLPRNLSNGVFPPHKICPYAEFQALKLQNVWSGSWKRHRRLLRTIKPCRVNLSRTTGAECGEKFRGSLVQLLLFYRNLHSQKIPILLLLGHIRTLPHWIPKANLSISFQFANR